MNNHQKSLNQIHNKIYLCDLNMDLLKHEVNPFVTSANPKGHPSRNVHKNDTYPWSGIHNPHKSVMIGTFFKLNNHGEKMKRVTANNNKQTYMTVNIPPGMTLVFKGRNINHRAPNEMRRNAPIMFQTNNFNVVKKCLRT